MIYHKIWVPEATSAHVCAALVLQVNIARIYNFSLAQKGSSKAIQVES